MCIAHNVSVLKADICNKITLLGHAEAGAIRGP